MKKNKNYWRGILFIILIIPVFLQSQIKINAIKTGYHTCFVDGVKIDKHVDLAKATTHCVELKIVNPKANVYFTYPEQTRIEVGNFTTIEIDTIQLTRRVDTDGVFVAGIIDNITHTAYWLSNEIDEMIAYPADSIINWQSIYNFKRTKQFGKISYENLNIPYQFTATTIVGSNFFFTVNKKTARITSWIDGIKFKEFIPGRWNEHGETDGLFTAYFGIPTNSSNKELKVEVENEAGEVIVYKTILKL